MRRVLFLGGVVCLALASAAAQEKPVVNKVATAKFAPTPSAPDCVTSFVERGDPSKGPSVILTKYSPGCVIPRHWHTTNEHNMVVSGTFRLEMKDEQPASLQAGDFALLPSRHVHRGKCLGPATCIWFRYLDSALDIHYVNEADQEIPRDEALKGMKKAAQPKPPAD